MEPSYLNILICASLNHRKKKKAEPCRLIPRKLVGNLEFLIVENNKDEGLPLCIAAVYVVP